MSQRVEWTSYTSLQYEPKGTEIGEHEVTGEGALSVASDGVIMVIEGGHDELRKMLTDALAALPGAEQSPGDEPRDYTVSLSNTFEAETPHDAVLQMVTWASDNAYAAGYRVTWHNADGTKVGSMFVDAERDIEPVKDPDAEMAENRETALREGLILGQFEDHREGCPVLTGQVAPGEMLSCTC